MQISPMSSEQAWQLTLLGDITRHIAALKKAFNEAGMPQARALWGEQFLKTNVPPQLNEQGWQAFPVTLKAIERGNDLTATFNVFPLVGSDRALEIPRMTGGRLEHIADYLRDSARTNVSEWNLAMVNAAISMMQAVSVTRYGVPPHVIESLVAGATETFQCGFADHLKR